ncbi:GNAT family N-acetyltransferase [Ferrimonas balearica]|uniref:GNAT family N-acetyltransferase n=1 Tax=Ferrimonas balearica TaxID=44012 RepID=UPI001C942B52|nr:GNAT family N-acetyltransferase [Ferrimonas balearica]MBY5979398.1 GNAT family N-acetyltransferase [Ferrimonas balearica]
MQQSERLVLREAHRADADFILALVNSEGWLRFIGDRGIRTLDQAIDYIENQLQSHYQAHGYGLYVVCLKPDHAPIGLCGLLNRDALPFPDLGFALLPQYHRQGFALEACKHVLNRAKTEWRLNTLLGITAPDNSASAALLSRLGFAETGTVRLEPASEAVRRFERSLLS